MKKVLLLALLTCAYSNSAFAKSNLYDCSATMTVINEYSVPQVEASPVKVTATKTTPSNFRQRLANNEMGTAKYACENKLGKVSGSMVFMGGESIVKEQSFFKSSN